MRPILSLLSPASDCPVVRKLQTSVQEAYTQRDWALAHASDLEREIKHLREKTASRQELSDRITEVQARSYTLDRNKTSQRPQIIASDVDQQLKVSKFRVSRNLLRRRREQRC